MKWTVAGAGALLCVAGIYALITGSSIIQVERGWATFIVGAVLLGAGAVVIAIAALMGRIDRLIAATQFSAVNAQDFHDEDSAGADASDGQAPPEPEPTPRMQRAARDVPPPPREVAVEPMPTLESVRSQAVAMPVTLSPPAPQEPAPDARPAGLRDFEFVFPPGEAAAKEAELAERVEPIQPLETARPSTLGGLGWLRRGKTEEPVSREMPPEPEPEPEPEPQPSFEHDVATAALSSHAAEQHPEPAPEPEPEEVRAPEERAEMAEFTWSDAKSDDVAPPADSKPEPQPAADPFSSDWLERALAGDDETQETSRFTPPSARRAAAAEQQSRDEAAAVESAAALEPAPFEDAPAGLQLVPPAETVFDNKPAPVEIGRYRANDVAYVMFSDGSITAETPAGGSYRFTSLVELRAFIERGGA
ncbi:MAG: uncharacterized protein JWN07_2713 [Hyphomicrobiales bacterium]|nr:uncharacterized protein [Hyphomicrobiales bacterium]